MIIMMKMMINEDENNDKNNHGYDNGNVDKK